MKNFCKSLTITLLISTSIDCQTISKKVDKVSQKEQQELSKWIGKTESKLTSTLGKPDRIDFDESRSRYYVYVSQKLRIKCERKFEINQNNVVLGFSSKNCF